MHTTTSTDYMPFYANAAERTLRQFIEAFWFEGALNGHIERQASGTESLHLTGLDENQNTVNYQISAYPLASFQRHRLHGPVRSGGAVTHDIANVVNHLLRHLSAQENKIQRFVNELKQTAAKQACSMSASHSPALTLPYALQEAQLGEGHLYHPCFRSRIGFSLEDHLRYGPEFAKPFSLTWLAVARDVSEIHALHDDESAYHEALQQTIGTEELGRLQQAIRQQGQDSAGFYLLPAHPWHWLHSLQVHFAHWLADGKLLYLGQGSGQWLAQQSIRSLSSLASSVRFNIKLPLAIANSSADRILSDHHVCNAPLITRWLQEICQQDAYLQQQARFVVLAEPVGITLRPGVAHKDNYGLLGAIWRVAPETVLDQGEHIFPCTALTAQNDRQQLEITPWLKQYGTETWVHALLKAMLPPFLHLMMRHGVLLEAHAQNTLLILRDGLPVGVAIRDLPGGLHYIAGHTTNEKQISQLRPAPAHRNAANASGGFAVHSISEARDYMLEVLLFIHLSELAHRLHRWNDFTENRFWQLAAQVVLSYQEQVPQLAARFAEFDLFANEIQIERLATRRLFAGTVQQFHAVPNPLRKHLQRQQPATARQQ